MNLRNLCWTLLLLSCILVSPVLAADDFFPLNKIKPGMIADGYTVFEGNEVESFKAKVLKVLPEGKGPGQFILVRLYGNKIELNGGIASGMSGSPIYIRGKLVGAIGYGFENADPYLAVVTPIESMLSLLDEAEKLQPKLSFNDSQYGYLQAVPVSTPLLISGLTQSSFERLTQGLEATELNPIQVATAAQSKISNSSVAVLKPGSALAVSLVTGDVNVVSLGTLTYFNDDYFLAFGHQFSGRGRVDYPASAAEIFTTVLGEKMSFRIGAATQPIGRVLIDRSNGISGKLKQFPTMIDVSVETTDVDLQKTQAANFKVVKDARLYPDLIAAGCLSSIEKALNRTGAGTAEVDIEIICADRQITHKNVFYGSEVSKSAVRDIGQLLKILAENEFMTVDPIAVNFKTKITEAKTTARIIKLEAAKNKVEAGATFDITATLRKYREGIAKVTFKVKIPENCRAGKLQFTLKGNSDVSEHDARQENSVYYSLNEEIADYLKNNKSNQLLLECDMELKGGSQQEKKYYTDFDCRVQGQATVSIEVQ